MNVLHIGILSHFTEGMLYQDNVLSEMNAGDGHKVTFITDTYCYKDGELIKVPEEDRILKNGVRLIRVNYDSLGNRFATEKIQKVKRINFLLEKLKPHAILYHGACGYELMDVAKYVRRHPKVLFYVDSHEDFHNTAKTSLAKFCYKYTHGLFLRQALPEIRKILYLSLETKEFLKKMYGIPNSKLEHFPLGGIVISREKQKKEREKLIETFHLPKDCIICSHSGKMVEEKRTKELLEAFGKVKNSKLQLFIFGSIPEDQKSVLLPLIKKDSRVRFLGWKNSEEMKDLLAGTDLYCQPGTQSATLQAALCAGCAAMVYPYSSHKYLIGENVLYVDSKAAIYQIFKNIGTGKMDIETWKNKAYETAKKKLDYHLLSQRILK